ncbi:MAG TPA: STM3941 family protein [Actinomycetota bacterium]|nr:STM3941 family protein [Actinomycetota bacterium]
MASALSQPANDPREQRPRRRLAPAPLPDILIPGGWRYTPGLLGALALAVFGFVVAVSPGISWLGRIVGFLDFLSFGFVGLVAASVAIRDTPTYLLTADGIRFPKQHWPTVPWGEVAGARVVSVGGQPHLAVDLVDADGAHPGGGRVGQRVLQLNQRRGWGFLTIPESSSPIPLDDLAEEVDRRAGAAGAARGPDPVRTLSLGRRLLIAAELPEVAVLGHGLLELLLTAKHEAAGVPAAVAAVLLLAAAIVLRYRPKLGVPLAIALESALLALALTLGHHVGAPARLLTALFPLCVLAFVGTQSAQR